jgi:hypothetical protein
METEKVDHVQYQQSLHKVESFSKQSVKALMNELPRESHYTKKSDMTIFVCGSRELAEELSKT